MPQIVGYVLGLRRNKPLAPFLGGQMKRSHTVIAAITLAGAGLVVAQTPAAESAGRYFHETKTVTVTSANVATCPAGWKVTGGGYADVPQTYNFTPDVKLESVQILKNGPAGSDAWEVRGVHTMSQKTNARIWLTKGYPLPLTVYAICTR